MHGVAEGFAGTESVQSAGINIRQDAMTKFGEAADREALKPNSWIAHVYEWGDDKDRNAVMPGPVGRLWFVKPTGSVGASATIQLMFRHSTVRVPVEDRDAGPPRAEHIWREKAHEQEYERSWTFRAGGNAKTRVSPGVSEYLYPYNKAGERIYQKVWTNYSEYTGNFTRFFESFWTMQGEQQIEKKLSGRLEKDFVPQVETMFRARIRRARRMPSGVGVMSNPLSIRVKGQPMGFGGMNTTPYRDVITKTRGLIKRISRGL